MKILWCSNASWAPTGYGVQTKLFLPRLRKLGHQMAGHFFWGLQGGLIHDGDIPLYPAGRHGFGQDVIVNHARHFGADIVISLMDAWVCAADQYPSDIRFCPWYPVDMRPLPAAVERQVRHAFQPIVFSRFGEQMSREAGLDPLYVPHGVDCGSFKPVPRNEARAKIGFHPDKFIVGIVAANKGYPSRKCFPENIRAFAELARKHDDVQLHIHTQSLLGEEQGMNIQELCQREGILDRCTFADQYLMGLGFDDGYMAHLYSSFDVLNAVSMGEGFGVPTLEAQACGLRVIVGEWAASKELLGDGWGIPDERGNCVEVYTPIAGNQWLPHWEAIYERLEAAYAARTTEHSETARKFALPYDADNVAQFYWKPALETIERKLRGSSDLLKRMQASWEVAQ